MTLDEQSKGFIDYYYEWMEAGRLPNANLGGLCKNLPSYMLESEAFKLIRPYIDDLHILEGEGLSDVYWASGCKSYSTPEHNLFLKYYGMTPLRETLLILAALLNNEKF